MGRYYRILCVTILVAALINAGVAILCYKCDGDGNDDCTNPQVHSHLVTNCTSEHTTCVTETITITNRTIQIIRGCGTQTSCNTRSDLRNSTCDICTTDLCNAPSSSSVPTFLSALILFVFVQYFVK